MSERINSINKLVAVLPFKKDTETKKPSKGLDFTDVTITKLVGAEVLYDSESFKAGDVLYFRSDVLRLPQANQKLQLGETIFLVLPEDLVVLRQNSVRGIVEGYGGENPSESI